MHWKLCKVPFFFLWWQHTGTHSLWQNKADEVQPSRGFWNLVTSPHYNFDWEKKESYAALRISLGLLKENIGGIKRKKRWTCSAKHFLSLSVCLAGSQEAVSEQKEKMNVCAKFQ